MTGQDEVNVKPATIRKRKQRSRQEYRFKELERNHKYYANKKLKSSGHEARMPAQISHMSWCVSISRFIQTAEENQEKEAEDAESGNFDKHAASFVVLDWFV